MSPGLLKPTNITVEFEYTLAEVREMVGTLTRRLLVKRMRRLTIVLASVFALYLVFLIFVLSHSSSPQPSTVGAAPAQSSSDGWMWMVVPWLVIFLALTVALARTMRGHATPPDHPLLNRHWTLTVDDHAIVMATTFERQELEWPAFIAFRETSRLFLLFRSTTSAVSIPRRVFTRPGDLEVFSQLIAERIQPRVAAFPIETWAPRSPSGR